MTEPLSLLVLLPALAGAVGLAARLPVRWAAALTTAASAGSVALAAAAWGGADGPRAAVWSWAPGLGVEVAWRANAATLALALLVAGIGALVLQYAGAYFQDGPVGRRAVGLLALFEAAMLGLVLSDNLFAFYVFWELTSLCSYFLIAVEGAEKPEAHAAAGRALLLTVGGGLAMLMGFVLLAAGAGVTRFSDLAGADLPPGLAVAALALCLPAVITKSAQVPAHFWLPGAMAAPSPVSAYLHSATMVKAGLVLLLFLFPAFAPSPLWALVLVPVGAATCVWGSYRALGEDDVKLLMAWSTVSQLGLLTLTLGLGTELALRAATLHLFAHALFKAGLFLTVGAVDHAAHTRSLSALGGLGRRAPLLAGAAALLAASMAGVPPVVGFLSKELILKKAMLGEWWIHALAIGGIVAGSIGTVAYSSRFFFETFAGEPRSGGTREAHAPGAGLLAAPLLLALAVLAGGPAAPWVERHFLAPVTAALAGAPVEAVPLSLWYGVNAAFVLSLAIVTFGYLFDRWLRLRLLPHAWAGEEGAVAFDRFFDRVQRLGGAIAAALADAPPRIYAAIALTVALLPAWTRLAPPRAADLDGASPLAAAVLVLLAMVLAALLAAHSRLTAVLLLSAVGIAVAALFRLLSAPDLMLTQLLVEVLTTVFFVLALRLLPPGLPQPPPRPESRAPRAAVAAIVGVGLGALVLAVQRDGPRPLRDFFLRAAPELAQGNNPVNVVLVDFRGLDTAVESLVVVLAAFGAVALLRGTELPGGGGPGEGGRRGGPR
ncbi:MAG: DUF4040 domain-containing protein [Thermoanaerobaculia bacterium]|nr:DUF4040 domain-containing protein [Thermoanaerobaculia bacterium]MCZ7652633.1 proton-conducting transporter membrane subunit [Thermoanaerobaculia bacterium]